MYSLICVKSLHDNCGCYKCREIKDGVDVLRWYRENMGKQSAFWGECFPEKEER